MRFDVRETINSFQKHKYKARMSLREASPISFEGREIDLMTMNFEPQEMHIYAAHRSKRIWIFNTFANSPSSPCVRAPRFLSQPSMIGISSLSVNMSRLCNITRTNIPSSPWAFPIRCIKCITDAYALNEREYYPDVGNFHQGNCQKYREYTKIVWACTTRALRDAKVCEGRSQRNFN